MARFAGSYREQSSSSEEEDLEDGLNFDQVPEEEYEEQLESIDNIISRRSIDNQINEAAENLSVLEADRDAAASPRTPPFTSPVVRFPVNAPALRPPPPPLEIMANFEDENGQDDDGALQNGLRQLKNFEVDMNDLDFTFNQIETKMQANGVKKQYTKFQILADIIPK